MNRLAPKYKEDFTKQIYVSSPKIRHPQICCFLEPIFVHSEFVGQRQLEMLMFALRGNVSLVRKIPMYFKKSKLSLV